MYLVFKFFVASYMDHTISTKKSSALVHLGKFYAYLNYISRAQCMTQPRATVNV